MNREVKFRGRNPLTKQWEYGFLITVDLSSEKLSKNLTAIIKENAWYEPSEGIGGFKLVEPQTVGQYTGLNDKNGKQIYEGDIVHIVGKTRVTENIKDSQGVFYITVEEGNWGFDFNWEHIKGYACSTHIMGCTDNDNRMDNVEVIGNIHDNPELFEVSNA